jgi:ribosomal protein L11 methyltransferase
VTGWVEIRISGATNRQAVIDALFECGSQGVEEAGAEIVTHLASGSDTDTVRRAILDADSGAVIQMRDASPVDSSDWRADVKSHRLGSLTVAPPWLSQNADPASTIVIDPAMAFGTGEHATTRGVIRLMQRIMIAESTVADLGAGSAVLSIAAAKENIRVNGVADRVHFLEGDAFVILPLVAPVSVVFANILSSVLAELLPVVHDSLAPGGHAILSGILFQERKMMLDEIERGDWSVVAEDSEEEWWSVLISRS